MAMTSISYVSTDTSVASSSSTTSTDDSDTDTLSEEKEVFLNILLTQLENQNPLDPVDTTEFTNQLVAYSSLEQEMTMNENLETIISALDETTTLNAFSYVGMDVELDTSASLMQDDVAEWTYVLEDDAEEVTVQIADSDGNILASYGIEAGTAGTYSFSVENSDLSEEVDEDAVLYLAVVAVDADGEEIGTDVTAIITVDSVATADGETTLTAGALSFSTDDVLSLRQSTSGNA
jgi:flagellar basal-body rod modification protein FlgD